MGIHPWNENRYADIELPFNPSNDFHRYGFLWTKNAISFVIDGHPMTTLTDLPPDTYPQKTLKGFIMGNTWIGTADWGGGPPQQNATVTYEWVRFYQGATSIPQ